MDAGSLGRSVTKSGLVIAALGFLLTRGTITLAVGDDPVQFLFAGLLPLVMGLLLAAFGVALAVGSFQARFVRTTAIWTLIGSGTMGVLVVSTVAGTSGMTMAAIEPGPLFSNFLIGGGVGGAIVGVYAGQNRRNRDELRHQANRLATLNRILRDQVLNAVTVIKGHVDVIEGQERAGSGGSVSIIAAQADSIEDSIEEVGTLTRTTAEDADLRAVELGPALAAAESRVASQYPEVTLDVSAPGGHHVCANQRLDHVFAHLLDNAARYNDAADPRVEVRVEERSQSVVVTIRDNGPGLPAEERATLESGDITEFDDPRSGFGLNVVRLLVESFGGVIHAAVDGTGTTIEVELARGHHGIANAESDLGAVRSYGVSRANLAWAVGAAVVAGAFMGLVMQAMAGIVPVIGALYGVRDPLVGWITHQFHSVVFGMIFASLVTWAAPWGRTLRGRLTVALAFAGFLWAFAAGVVMPFWLQLLGLPASLPNLTGAALVGHLVWGGTLGLVYHAIAAWQEG